MELRMKISHKLTLAQKQEIWDLVKAGYSPTDICKKFGVGRMTVYKISKKERAI
jgi:DNA invertase Pin-like site-specific DNA recombinase